LILLADNSVVLADELEDKLICFITTALCRCQQQTKVDSPHIRLKKDLGISQGNKVSLMAVFILIYCF
jgi:hypothetical protein